MIDAVDKKILELLAENARMTNAELAGKLGMAPSGALKRVRHLEEAGVIKRYETRVSDAALGITTTTFVKVFTNERLGRNEVGKRLAELPEVQEVHYLAGNIDYLLKVRVRDTSGYMDFIRKLGAIEDVRTCESMVVLETFKETAALSIPTPGRAP